MKHIYLFSGLGADERVFKYIKLDDSKLHHIYWEKPIENESLQEYARRIAQKITTKNNYAIGLSFGGVMAQEVSSFVHFEKIILISTISSYKHLPWIYRLIGYTGIANLIPKFLFSIYSPAAAYLFGIKKPQSKKLLKEILHHTDPSFAKWAMKNLITWKGEFQYNNCISIHGDRDRLLPLNRNVTYVIKGGTHFMIVDSSQEINRLIHHIISTNEL